MDLLGKAALITGAKRIGAVVATELARRGADIALSYRSSRAEAEATADAVRHLGRRAHVQRADVVDAVDCLRLVDESASALGRLDILINMASIYDRAPFDELTAAHWDRHVSVDARASYLCALAAVPHMRRAGAGRIINVSDWVAASGRPRYPGYLCYYVAKKAVIGLTEALALELAANNILVNAVAPGPIVAPPDLSETELQAVEEATPVGHWGGEIEIARAVVLLIESEFLTGETIRVDGGRHVR
jgi:NAD(P)-dependent dehydrogenase (short-subunit alcohol dehydrogenase family)